MDLQYEDLDSGGKDLDLDLHCEDLDLDSGGKDLDLDLHCEDLDLDSGGKDLDLDLNLNFEDLTTSLDSGAKHNMLYVDTRKWYQFFYICHGH